MANVGALLDDAAVLQHHDAVGVLHRGQPVGNDQRGALPGVALHGRSSAACTMRSLSASSALVASSSSSSGGFFSMARAMAMRWRWPPDRRTPRSPRKVS
jgi:hypothetical protein